MQLSIVVLAIVASVAGIPQRGSTPKRPTTTTSNDNSTTDTPLLGLPAVNVSLPSVAPLNNNNRTSTPPTNNSTAPPAAKETSTAKSPLLTSGCSKTCRRKEVRQLSKAERDAFIAAIRKMQSGPAPTEYDRFVKMHVDAKTFAHGNSYFLPWHRGFLLEFERALQRIDPSVCLPYWNWSLDSQAPELAVVFNNDFLGGNGGTNGNGGGCVQSGPFAQWRPYYPQPHCLERRFDGNDKISALHSIESVNRVLTSNKDYNSFRRAIETGIHPGVHNQVGGDISAMHSPNDPLFFLHHGYIEFLWVSFQKMNGNVRFAGPGLNGDDASLNQPLLGLDFTAGQVMDTSSLCYEYVELGDNDLGDGKLPPSTIKPPSGGQHPPSVSVGEIPNTSDRYDPLDRTNIGCLRVPPPVSDAWLEMNGQDVKYAREFEQEYRNVYNELNNIKGYKSPCALWSRPSLFAKLVERTPSTDMYVDVPDVGRVKVSGSELTKEDGAKDPYQVISDVKVVCVIVAPDVELPAETYSAKLENVVGRQAFTGAGSLIKKINPDAAAAPSLPATFLNSHSLMALSTAMAVVVFQALA